MPTTPVLEGTVVDQPRAVKVFGREPAVLLGLIGSAIALFVVLFGADLSLDGDFTAVAMAVVSAALGFYSAWATRDTLLGVSVGLVKALISLGLYFGLDLSVELQAAVMLFVESFVGFWQRTQTSPLADPVDPSPQQVTPSPLDEPGAHRDDDGDGIADGVIRYPGQPHA